MSAMLACVPGQVQVRSAIEVQFILEDLVHSIRGGTILRDLEFGDLLTTGIAGRVRSGAR